MTRYRLKNYWRKGSKITLIIMLESIIYSTTTRSRRVTYIGFFNFCLMIYGKSNELKHTK
jgi:hypothetical protein